MLHYVSAVRPTRYLLLIHLLLKYHYSKDKYSSNLNDSDFTITIRG